MDLDELKIQIEAYRKGLKAKSGSACHFSPTGPVDLALIDSIVAVLEGLREQIENLERKVRDAQRHR